MRLRSNARGPAELIVWISAGLSVRRAARSRFWNAGTRLTGLLLAISILLLSGLSMRLSATTLPGKVWLPLVSKPGEESLLGPGLEVELFLRDIHFPVALAFAPDGRLFYAERFANLA